MAKQSIKDLLAKRNPLTQREAVQPANFYHQATKSNDQPVQEQPITKPSETKVRDTRTDKASERTVRTNAQTERFIPNDVSTGNKSLIEEIQKGVDEADKRPTERYSFEIYSDQKQKIEDVQYMYKKRTGKKLSSSRIMREALDKYIDEAMEALK